MKALETSRVIGDKTGEAFDAINLGNSYAFLGKYEPAIEYLERSLTINKAAGEQAGRSE